MMGTVLVDYKSEDWRGFIFVVHETLGLLLLYCTRKKNKGPHYQAPGGHVDDIEFIKAASTANTRNTQLLLAAQTGAARELYEETGIDLRNHLDRVQPVKLRQEEKKDTLDNEYKQRLFFTVTVKDSDFPPKGVAPMEDTGKHLKLKISAEHQGYTFVLDFPKAAGMLQQHSGGKVKEGLLMAAQSGSLCLPATPVSSATKSTPFGLVQPASETSTERRKKTDKNALPFPATRDAPRVNLFPDSSTKGQNAAPVNLFPPAERKGWKCCWCS